MKRNQCNCRDCRIIALYLDCHYYESDSSNRNRPDSLPAYFYFICIKRPTILLCITFIINYIIMGINRYYPIPIPITNIFDLLFGIMLTLIILKQVYTDDDNRKNAMNAYTFVLLGWLLYCIINAGNGITGELYPEAWLRILRPWAIYPLLTCFILSIHCNRYSFLHYFLILWGIFTLLAAAKGYWQKNKGFDSTELAWLWAYGARTHFIHSGIRYFSFLQMQPYSDLLWDYHAPPFSCRHYTPKTDTSSYSIL